MELNETVTKDFTTHNPTTGNVQDADALPTCQIFEDTTDTAILSPLVTKRTGLTGDYRITFTVSSSNGFEIRKSYNIIAEATVAGITAKATLMSFNVTAKRVSYVV